MERELYKPEHLVHLNEHKLLPPFLVERWKARTGYDPVVTAYQRVQHYQFYDNVLSRLWSWSALLQLLAGCALCYLVADWNASSAEMRRYVLIVMGVFTLAAVVLHITRRRLAHKHPHPEQEALKSCYGFIAALRNLIEWAGGDIERLPPRPHQIEQFATGLLVTAAKDILVFNAKTVSSVPDGPRFQLVSGDEWELSESFRTKYDTLRDLGLLAKKGYDPYYKAAQGLLDKGVTA